MSEWESEEEGYEEGYEEEDWEGEYEWDEYGEEGYEGEYEESYEEGGGEVEAPRRYDRCCGSGFPAYYCGKCHHYVCEKCHGSVASQNIQAPHAFTFQTYVELREMISHAEKFGGGPDPEIRRRMAEARIRLMTNYGIDPDRENAYELYDWAMRPSYLEYLAENSLKPSHGNALRFIAEKNISIRGFTEDEVARALNHNLQRVYERHVGERRRYLKKTILIHYESLLLTGSDDRSALELTHEEIVRLSGVFGKIEPDLESYIKTTVPVTLSNLKDDDEDVQTIRAVQRLLDEAEKLHLDAKAVRNRLYKHFKRSEAAKKILRAEELLKSVKERIKEKFPEIGPDAIRWLYAQSYMLSGELRRFMEMVIEGEAEMAESRQSSLDSYYQTTIDDH